MAGLRVCLHLFIYIFICLFNIFVSNIYQLKATGTFDIYLLTSIFEYNCFTYKNINNGIRKSVNIIIYHYVLRLLPQLYK